MYEDRFKPSDSRSNHSNQIKRSRRTKCKINSFTSLESHQKSNRSHRQLSNLLPTILIITSFIPINRSIPIEPTNQSDPSHSDPITQNDDRSELDPISLHQAKLKSDLSSLNLKDRLSSSSPSFIKQFPSPSSDPSYPQSTLLHLDPSTSQSSLEYTSHPDFSADRSATSPPKSLLASKLDQLSSSTNTRNEPQPESPSISALDSLLSSHDSNRPLPTNSPSQSDSQQSEPPHFNSQLSFSPSQSHRIPIPIKASIPTYFENVNGTWVLSDNWNLYGLSGPSQRHRARSLPTNKAPRSSKQPRSAPLVHHTSLAARTNELESNASLGNNTNNSMNSSTNLDLPAGWNHTSPRGPMYVVPAIVIASLFIAISVVGTVVCLVGRRRKNKRISTMRRNEEAEIEGDKSPEADEKRINEMSDKGKRKKMTVKRLLIVQFNNHGSEKKQENGVGPDSLLILDENPRLGKRSFRSGIGPRLTRRRNRASDKIKGTQNDKTIEDDQKPSSGYSGSSADAVMVNELSSAPKPLTDDASGIEGSRATTTQSSAAITNTSHGHDTVHTTSSSSHALSQTVTSFNLQRLTTDESQAEALTATALTRQSAQLERAQEQQDRAGSEVSSVHNSVPSLQISQHLSLQPIMGPRSIFPDDPHLEDLPPEPPAYTTSRKSEDKRPMRRASSSSASSSNRRQYIAHVATDDKLVLGNIARLASSAPLTETETRPDQGPSAPPLVWEEVPIIEDQLEVQRGILPAPSMEFVTSFDPNRKDEEKLKMKAEEMKTWALLVEPSRPEDSEEDRRERDELEISVPEAEAVEEEGEEERERERRENCLPIAPPYEEEEEIDQG